MVRSKTATVLFLLLATFPALAGTWRDDFNDGDIAEWRMVACDWRARVVFPDTGNWEVVDGAAVAGDDNSSMVYGLVIGDMSWTDCTAEVSVKLSKKLEACSGSSGIWLGARYQVGKGKLGLNDYVVGLWNDNGAARRGGFKYSGGDFFNIQSMPSPTKTDTWYRLKIEVVGDQITAFVDDVKVCVFKDNSFTSGLVGIAVNGVIAMFDDFMVTGPNIPDYDPGFAVSLLNKLTTVWGRVK